MYPLSLLVLFTLLSTREMGHSKPLSSLVRRRLDQEGKIKTSDYVKEPCDAAICTFLGNAVPVALGAAAYACAPQDLADRIISTSKTVSNPKLRVELIAWAKAICNAEKNTPPATSGNSQTQRNLNFVYCQKAPENPELNDCLPKQYEGNDPKAFFDPSAGGKIVSLDEVPGTRPRTRQLTSKLDPNLPVISATTSPKQNVTVFDSSAIVGKPNSALTVVQSKSPSGGNKILVLRANVDDSTRTNPPSNQL